METYSVEAVISAVDKGFTKGMKEAQESMSGLDDSVQKTNTSIFDIVKGVGVFKLLDAGIGLVTDSLGGAIERYDKLSQFPKVLSALGATTSEAESATSKLKEGIDGLPTTLQDVADTTQQMYSVFKDADVAADSTLALNNALLASGADSAKAARGTEQYLKILRTGKVDMDSYTTLQETMGVGLDKLSEKIGFTGASAQSDLYKALQSGEVPISQFNQGLIDIQDGLDGTAAIAKTSTEGIGTSMTNLKNSVKNGLANVITAIDDGLKDAGLGSIAENFNSLKGVVSDVFENIVEAVPTVISAVTGFINVLKAFKPVILSVTAAFVAYKAAMGIASIISSVSKAMTVLKVAFAIGKDVELLSFALGNMASSSKLAAAGQAVLNAVMSINPFALAIASITAVVAALAYFFTQTETGQKVWARLADGFWKAIEIIKQAVSGAVEWIQNAWAGTKDFFVNAWNGVIEFFSGLWQGITDSVSEAVQNIKDAWSDTKAFFSGLWDGIKEGAIEAWNNLTSSVSDIFSKVTAPFEPLVSWFGTLWDSIGSIAGSAWELIKTIIMGPILLLIDLVTGNFEQLKTDAINLWNTLTTNIMNIVTTFVDLIVSYYTALKDTVVNLWNELVLEATTLWSMFSSWISEAVNTIVTTVVAAWENFKQSTVDLFNNTVQGVKDLWTAFTTWISDTIDNIKNSAIDGFNNMKQSVVDTFNNLVTGAQNAWDSLVSGVSTAIDSVKEWFNKLKDINLLDIGKAIIDGFVGGLKDACEAGKDFVGGIGDWIPENKGPIEKDRKLLIPAGLAIMDGFRTALSDGFGGVQSDVSGMGDRLASAMNTDYSMDIGANVARANRSINSEVTHQVNYGGNSNPTVLNVHLGSQTLKILAGDISELQGKQSDIYAEF